MVTQVELQHIFTALAEHTRALRDFEKMLMELAREAAIEHQKAAHRYDTITREHSHHFLALEDISQRMRRMKAQTAQTQTTSFSWSDITGSALVRHTAYALALGISNWIAIGSFNLPEVIKAAFSQ